MKATRPIIIYFSPSIIYSQNKNKETDRYNKKYKIIYRKYKQKQK